MRILTACGNLERGGTQRAAQNYTLAYQRAGYAVAVLGWAGGGVREAKLRDAGVPVIIGHDARAIAEVDAFDPDVIHIHRPGVADPFITDLMRRLKRGDRRIVETNVFSRVDLSEGGDLIDIHFQLSSWCMWKWRRWLGGQRRNRAGVVVPYGIEAADFSPVSAEQVAAFRDLHAIPRDVFLCGRVGQPDDIKWHPANIAAFETLAQRDLAAHLVLIGLPHTYQPQMEALPAHVRRRITLLPLSDRDDWLQTLYGSLDCFLHAARIGESFGYVLAESMMCGTPVVTAARPHKDNSQIEVVENGVTGFCAGSVNKLAAALDLIWEDRALRDRIRPILRQRVLDRFASDTVAALALRAMRHALDHGDRAKLLAALEADEHLRTDTSTAEVNAMLRDTVGGPDAGEVFRMRLMHIPLVQRVAQSYLQATRYRKWRSENRPGSG